MLLQFTAPIGAQDDDGDPLETRRLKGPAVPWNVTATTSGGQTVRFMPGSVDLSGAPVVLHHDETRPIGKVVATADDDAAHHATVAVSEVPDGDAALVLAADGALTGWSVGVEPTEFSDDDGVLVITASAARHLALVTTPAFSEARVTDVAAQAPDPDQGTGSTNQEGESSMDTATVQTEQAAAVASAPRIPAVTASAGPLPSIGQYLYASLKRKEQPLEFERLQAAVRAAAPHTFVGDVPGLVPEPIVGAVLQTRASNRPLFDAFGPLAGPEGSSFRRPLITDPIADAISAEEKSDVTDQLIVSDVDVAYTFIKRAANLSAEAIAFTSPQVLDVVAADLARAYARGAEKVAATAIQAAGGTPTDISTDVSAGLYTAAAGIYAAVGVLPDTLAVAPDVWAALGGAAAEDGRPLFPVIGPSNTGGTADGATSFSMNILGLRVIVSWALQPGACRLIASEFVESYETARVSMRTDEATILGVALGLGGAVATKVLVGGAAKALDVLPVGP